jgi:integrase
LTWDRIDLDKMEIRVDRQLERKKISELFGDPKTEASNRQVHFGKTLRDLLLAHREKFGIGPNGLLTSNRLGDVYVYRAASETYNKIARKLGLPIGSGLHMLRHTYAANAISAGVHIKELQIQLGHESITETLDTYGHLMVENRSDFVAKMEAEYKKHSVGRKQNLVRLAE